MIEVMNAAADISLADAKDSFVEKLQRRLLRQFRLQVADWQETCRELPEWEDQNLLDSSGSNLDKHAEMVGELERVGLLLLELGRHPEFQDTESIQQLELTPRDLADSGAMWHGNLSDERRRDVLEACFNES